MPNLLQQAGAVPQKQAKYQPIFIDRTFTGLYSQRAVLHDPADVVTSKFYGGRPDALLDGSNVELTNRLTLQRRPGLSQFSCAVYPTAPLTAFSFQLTNGTIQVIVDTGSATFTFDKVEEVSGTAYYLFSTSQPLAANNAFAGYIFQITGFDQPNNNGTFTCTASTSSYLILNNTAAITDTEVGTGTTAGAVYYDLQSGCQKTLLFGKSPGAGQSYFVAVAGILYIGDGVDLKIYTPLGANGTVWNWGAAAPVNPPGIATVESGSAAVQWQASTLYSTMGLLKDANGNVEFLTGVNASGTNTTQYGTSGDGQPNWQTTTGLTTPDGTCTWTCWGPIGLWTPNTTYTFEQPIFDPTTGWIFQSSGGKSGASQPKFNPTINTHTNDANGVIWQAIGPAVLWKPNFTYHAWWEHLICAVCEPALPTEALLQANTQTVFLQTNNDQTIGHNDDPGVSGSGYTPPWPALGVSGKTTADGDLQWVSLGTATWAADTSYFQWGAGITDFSVVEDPYGDFQVCVTSGTSGGTQPYSQWQASHSYSGSSTIAVPNSSHSFTLFTTSAGGTSGSSQPQWDFTPSSPTSDGSVTWTATATTVTNVWGNIYGSNTSDGTTTWTNVGPITTWATNTIWYYPKAGFAPPTSSQPYGGAEVIGGGDVQAVIASGVSGSTQPNWPSSLDFTLTAVANAIGQTVVYTGTITNGGSSAYAGYQFIITGFTTAANNGTFVCTASSTTTLTLVNPAATSESHAATAQGTLGSQVTDGTAVWYTESAFSQQSLSWNIGLAYAYSYASRLPTDFYNTNPPPGIASPLGTPTGSETGLITTASPAALITGSNAGAVNTISGIGPTDPALDTIIIWRSADGGGSSNMFFLTEFNAPKPINGMAQPWQFEDYLPSTATAVFPGLNPLEPAPIDDSNNPPPTGFLPMVFNFNRIWGSVGSTVYFSGGPDVITGTSTFSYAPADNFPFLAPVVRLVKTSQGLVTFLTDSIELIAGGPATTTFFSVTLSPGIGLGNYNALDVYAGELNFLSADGQFKALSPSLSLTNLGFAIGDKLAGLNPQKVYVAVQEAGVDNAIYIADGSTGWFRLNPRQIPGLSGPEPIWSPFAHVVGGAQMVESIEVSAGIKKLLVGSPSGGNVILERNLNVFTDNGSVYDAFFIMGSITLAHSGQIAVLRHLEADFSGVNYKPTISYMLNEIASPPGQFTVMPNINQVFDPPEIYGFGSGQYGTPVSYSPNRYYFSSTGSLARCRHLQLKFDFGSTVNGDEVYSICIYGRLMVEL